MLRLTLREGKPTFVTTPWGRTIEVNLLEMTATRAKIAINWGPPFQPADAACDEPCGPELETIDEHSEET